MFKNKNSWFTLSLVFFILLVCSCTSSSSSSEKVSRKATQLARSEVSYINSTDSTINLINEEELKATLIDAEADVITEVELDENQPVENVIIEGYEFSIQGQIVRVSDGDTVVLLDEDKTQHRVRLDGIDCPESKQAYGTKATQYVREKLGEGKVLVYYNKKDRYGRLLGVLVNSKGENINELLLANGLAWHYIYYNKNPLYSQLEKEARAKQLNIWSDKNPIEPHEFRKMKRNKK